jgi:peptidoglycan hydrolase-like protein with peptidoglycan-binding domain
VFKAFLPALAIFALAWAACAATPAKPRKRHHRPAASASKTPAKKSTQIAATGTTKTAAHRKGKSPRRPSRSRQQAPSPERYKEIQQSLASKGYLQGDPTGEWGPDSVDALKRFQTDQNLTPDGKIGSLSLIALGLGPKRLSAKSDSAPPQPGTPAPGTTPGPPPPAPPQ